MSYRTVLSTGSSRDSKTSELNCFYKSMKHYVLYHYHQFWEGSCICIGLFQKQTGDWGYGVSRVIEEIASAFSGELIKSNVEYSGVVLVLGLKISVGCNIVLWNFYGWSLVLFGISRGKDNCQGVFKNVCPEPPPACSFFFLE